MHEWKKPPGNLPVVRILQEYIVPLCTESLATCCAVHLNDELWDGIVKDFAPHPVDLQIHKKEIQDYFAWDH